MTEAEWLAATDPKQILDLFGVSPKYWQFEPDSTLPVKRNRIHMPVHSTSDRKLRLFACALANSLTDADQCRSIIEAAARAEQFVDGMIAEEEWNEVQKGYTFVTLHEAKQAVWNTLFFRFARTKAAPECIECLRNSNRTCP